MIRDYYHITKPGIVGGNAVAVVAGFFLASKGSVDWFLLLATLVGLSLVVASGCVMNNYIDRDIDGKMERTKNRVLVRGFVPLRNALVYGKVLAVTGLGILALYVNWLTVIVSMIGLFVYVVLYSMWLKRTSVYGTLVGSISGAVPPVVGYLAVSNSVDLGAVILFFVLAFWQMPHSYAIAIYRLEDYVAAGIPVLPAKKGIAAAKIQTVIYVALFMLATHSLAVFGYGGYFYFAIMTLLGFVWLGLAIRGFWVVNDRLWARRMSLFSILILVVFCVAIVFDAIV